MLFCSKSDAGKTNHPPVEANIPTIDIGKIVLGGGFRLPVRTADTGALRLGGGFRLPLRSA